MITAARAGLRGGGSRGRPRSPAGEVRGRTAAVTRGINCCVSDSRCRGGGGGGFKAIREAYMEEALLIIATCINVFTYSTDIFYQLLWAGHGSRCQRYSNK